VTQTFPAALQKPPSRKDKRFPVENSDEVFVDVEAGLTYQRRDYEDGNGSQGRGLLNRTAGTPSLPATPSSNTGAAVAQ
jgi:hypothetical protein